MSQITTNSELPYTDEMWNNLSNAIQIVENGIKKFLDILDSLCRMNIILQRLQGGLYPNHWFTVVGYQPPQ